MGGWRRLALVDLLSYYDVISTASTLTVRCLIRSEFMRYNLCVCVWGGGGVGFWPAFLPYGLVETMGLISTPSWT